MHGFFLCWRYLRKRRIAFFGVMAVGLCVALLIVITSLFRGFLREFDRHWEQQFGQIELQTGRLELAKWAELSDALEGLASIERAVAVAETPALLYLGRGDLRPVQLVGVPAEKLRQERTFREGLLLQGSEAAPSFELSAEAKTQARQWMSRRGGPAQETLPVGAIVGIGLLGRPDEQTDEYDEEAVAARIEAQKAPMFILYGRRDASQDDEALPAVRKVRRRVWVTDAVETGQYEADTRFVYLPFDYVRQLVGTETAGQYHCAGRMRIYVREGWTTPAALEQVRQRWAEFCRKELGWSGSRISQVEVKPSLETDYLRMITREIRKQLAVMEVLMGLIFSVAALLVFVIMLMIVMQKRRDIGIMRAVGWAGGPRVISRCSKAC